MQGRFYGFNTPTSGSPTRFSHLSGVFSGRLSDRMIIPNSWAWTTDSGFSGIAFDSASIIRDATSVQPASISANYYIAY